MLCLEVEVPDIKLYIFGFNQHYNHVNCLSGFGRSQSWIIFFLGCSGLFLENTIDFFLDALCKESHISVM